MRALSRLLLLTLVLAVLLPAAVVLAALDHTPTVSGDAALAPEDVRRVKQLLKTHDPRSLEAGEIRTLRLTEQELNLLLRYGLGRLAPVAAEAGLDAGRVSVAATVAVADTPLGRYLNLAADLDLAAGIPRVASARLGGIPIPAAVANLLVDAAHALLLRQGLYRQTLEAVNGIRVSREQLAVVYQWQPGLMAQARETGRDLLLPAGEQERLLAHHHRLATLTREEAERRPPMTDLLVPLMAEARRRTKAGGDPGGENRAVLTVLALYVQGVSLPRLLGIADLPEPARTVPMLRGRRDLAQHFLISAGVAVVAGTRLADAVGLLKEVDDSRYGSGFSFTDLAADRAGVRFAALATASPAAARRLQARVAQGIRGDELVPDLRGLDEYLTEAEFRARYQRVDSPAYRRVLEDIEERILALPLYR